jgi:adenine-specific DNA glycosylase
MTMVRRYPVEKRIRAVGRTREASCELASEAVECIPWLRRRLLSWFERNGRSFPWRHPGRTAYEVVVAEILLQRTTAAGVARAYSGFIERYPSWASLAQARPEAEARGPLHAFALRLVSGKRSLEINWAVLDLGALVCRARRPRCPECPLRTRCRFFKQLQPRPTPTAGAL